MKTIRLAMALALGCVTAGAANAAAFTKSYVLTSTGFFSAFGTGAIAPYDTVVQNFTITFDPAVRDLPVYTNYSSTAGGVLRLAPTIRGIGYREDSFEYSFSAELDDDLYTSRFATDLEGNPLAGRYIYYITGEDRFLSTTSTLVIAPDIAVTDPATPVSPVPEPATWAMMTFGFGAIGFAMRRRKAVTGIRFA